MLSKMHNSAASVSKKTSERLSTTIHAENTSPPPEEAKPAEDGIKGAFWEYIYKNRYSEDEPPSKSKQTTEDRFKEKVGRIQRIEKAIKAGVQEILTFEFFNFSSPASSVDDKVVAEIFLISFNDGRRPEVFPLFDGPLPLRCERDERVLYFPVPPSFTQDSSVFLVARVDVTTKSLGRRRAMAAGAAQQKITVDRFWGTKCVSRSGEDSFEAIYGSSAINLVCPMKGDRSTRMLLLEEWFLDKNTVSGLEVQTKAMLASSTLPRVDYELSNQHCEEDWEEISLGMKDWEQRIRVEEEGDSTSFIVENEVPEVLAKLPSLRCPFSGVDFESQEKLMNHLEAAYPRLEFVQEDNSTIVVRLSAISEQKKAQGRPVQHKWPAGPLPLKCLAFNPPREVKISFSSNLNNETRFVPHGNWLQNKMWRNISNDMTLDPNTKDFMKLVNEHMQMDDSAVLGPRAIRKAFMAFVTNNAQMLSDKNMHLMALTMAIKLQNQHILTPDDYTDLFEIISLTD